MDPKLHQLRGEEALRMLDSLERECQKSFQRMRGAIGAVGDAETYHQLVRSKHDVNEALMWLERSLAKLAEVTLDIADRLGTDDHA